MSGVKHDDGKPRFSLVPWMALRETVHVLMFGAEKYAPDNWRLVDDGLSRYLDGALRHITAYLAGDTYDEDSGLPHLAHAACCILFALHFDRSEHGETEALRVADAMSKARAWKTAAIGAVTTPKPREGSPCATGSLPHHLYVNGACVACGVKP